MNPQRIAVHSQALALAYAADHENPVLKAAQFVYGTLLSLVHVLLRVAIALLVIVSPLIVIALTVMLFDLSMAAVHQVQKLL
jgi:hypothetical protein